VGALDEAVTPEAGDIVFTYEATVGAFAVMPWLSWHCFRRTHTTLANELGMAFTDRMAMMGHSEARMTALYTADDLQRRRTVLDQMAARLLPTPAPPQAQSPAR
jgi:integrase